MDTTTYLLLGQRQALETRLDIAANNIANVNTPGFKKEQAQFSDRLVNAGATDVPQAKASDFVVDLRDRHNMLPGAFQATGNPLDIAIEGDGFLSVQTPSSTGYTRAGNLTVDGQGRLVTAAGMAVLADNGAPITIPPEDRATLRIDADGSIMAAGQAIARLGLTRFADQGALVPAGDATFTGTGGTPVPAADVHVKTGGFEGSNVDPIGETTQMIDILRNYQASASLTGSIDAMRTRAIEQLGKI